MPQGIACIGLSIVDGAGNLVKLVSYPKPVPGDTAAGVSTEDMEDTIQTQVFSEQDTAGPGPMALIQFRIWESGRLDFEKLTGDTDSLRGIHIFTNDKCYFRFAALFYPAVHVGRNPGVQDVVRSPGSEGCSGGSAGGHE